MHSPHKAYSSAHMFYEAKRHPKPHDLILVYGKIKETISVNQLPELTTIYERSVFQPPEVKHLRTELVYQIRSLGGDSPPRREAPSQTLDSCSSSVSPSIDSTDPPGSIHGLQPYHSPTLPLISYHTRGHSKYRLN